MKTRNIIFALSFLIFAKEIKSGEFYQGALDSCFDIWASIDMVKGINSQESDSLFFCQKILNSLFTLYESVIQVPNTINNISEEDYNFLQRLFYEIKENFTELFCNKELIAMRSSDYNCLTKTIQLLFERICLII